MWQALLFVALAGLQARQTIQQGKQQAKAVTQRAELDARNKALEVKRRTAALQSSFLSSGFELEGTPISSITGIFDTGIADINQIGINANKQSKNIMQNARSNALEGLLSAAASSGISSGANPAGLFTETQSPAPIEQRNPYERVRL